MSLMSTICYGATWRITLCFSCVCPVIDHEFRHNIVKVAVVHEGPSGSADNFDNIMAKFIVNNRRDA